MKLKEIFYGLGLKPKAREYSFDIDTFPLPKEGEIQFARWRHPHERRKEFTQKSIDALRKFIRAGDVALDIGAHTGDTALPMALAAGPSGAVLALEPNRYVYKVLLANSGLNRKRANIIPLNFAATPEDGKFEFEYSDPGFCNGGLHEGISEWKHTHFFKLKVIGKNILKYLEREFPDELARLRFIKIDTEGFDRQVAGSLRPLLQTRRPFLRSEIYQHLSGEERRGYFRELRELGYRVHKFNDAEDYAGEVLDENMMTKWEHFDIFAVPQS
jgi:FkbM family methyltransferase